MKRTWSYWSVLGVGTICLLGSVSGTAAAEPETKPPAGLRMDRAVTWVYGAEQWMGKTGRVPVVHESQSHHIPGVDRGSGFASAAGSVGTVAVADGSAAASADSVGESIAAQSALVDAPTAVAEELPQQVRYKVNAGDTLYRIARQFDVPLAVLLQANSDIDPNRLQVGQLLAVPVEDAVLRKRAKEGHVIKQVLNSTLTAYTAGFESTGKHPGHPAYGITRSGSQAEEGRTIAVDPKLIPLGSSVVIDGIGFRTAEDTGSAIKGSRIDVFMNDLDEALQFGVKKNVKVFVLDDRAV